MENNTTGNDLLKIHLTIAASPAVSFNEPLAEKEKSSGTPDPVDGFNLLVDAALQYHSFSILVNQYLHNKKFSIGEGFLKRTILIKDCEITGATDFIHLRMAFSGSFTGWLYVRAKPVYNDSLKTMELQALEYELKTEDFLLKAAKWLFQQRIAKELKRYASFDISAYYVALLKAIREALYKEWKRGIWTTGEVTAVSITGIKALPEHLLLQGTCSGTLRITIAELHVGI